VVKELGRFHPSALRHLLPLSTSPKCLYLAKFIGTKYAVDRIVNMVGGEFGEICWREKWNILGAMWKGVERWDFFNICIKDNGYMALFCCPSSKQVKTSCKNTHLLCSLWCFGLRQRAVWLPTFNEESVTYSVTVQDCWLRPARIHVVVSQSTTVRISDTCSWLVLLYFKMTLIQVFRGFSQSLQTFEDSVWNQASMCSRSFPVYYLLPSVDSSNACVAIM
jgi:hypothetical protein